jgi:LysR family glycine cleavage system transcriptional activator
VLEQERWLWWRPWLQWLGVPDVDITRGPRFTDAHVQIQATVHGLGVTLGRSALVFDALETGRLVRPFAVSRAADFTYYAVTPEALADDPAVAAFMDWIEDEASAFESHLSPDRSEQGGDTDSDGGDAPPSGA